MPSAPATVDFSHVANWLPLLLLAVGLAASSGLNTFLPLLALALSTRYGWFGVSLGEGFGWLHSDFALGVLGLATALEIVADKVPVVDHCLDVIGAVARPVAGALAAAAVFRTGDPATAVLLGIVVGAPTAFGFHAAKAGTRAASSTVSLGLGNPLLSLLEDLAAVVITAVALFFPWLVPLFLLVAGLIFWRLLKWLRLRVAAMQQWRRSVVRPG